VLLRRVRSAIAVAVAIGGSALAVAPSPGPAAASVGSPTLTLLSQTPSVTPVAPGDPAPFTIQVEVNGSVPKDAELGLTFYQKLGTRSAFEQTLTSPPTDVLQALAPTPVAGMKAGRRGGLQSTTTIVPDTPEASDSGSIDLSARHACVVGSGRCSGVYPVVVQLLGPSGSVVAHLTTYLIYAEERSTNPLVFSWVVPFGAPVDIRTRGNLSDPFIPLSASRARDLSFLGRALVQDAGVKVSIAASPATVQQLAVSTSTDARAALGAIGSLAVGGSATHELIAQPYVPVNLASIASAGVGAEIQGQMQGGQRIMEQLLGGLPDVDQPSKTTWVATGPVNPSIVGGLHIAKASDLVLPEAALEPATELDDATWSQPFTLLAGKGQVGKAAVIDAQLSSYFTDDPGDPVLAANQLLADLAQIHYELPGASDPTRGVIAVPPSDWDPDPAFVSALLTGLNGNPIVTTATLTQYFSGLVPVGGNQAATTRRLAAAGSGQQFTNGQAVAIVAARIDIDGFTKAVQGDAALVAQLEDLLLASESSELKPAAQRAGVATFQRHLAAELSGIQVLTSTVTLTARTASIPITIVSSASYHLQAKLTLSSAKLEFPAGSTRRVSIDHPTNTTQVEVKALTSGDLPLAFTLTSPDGSLIIAHGRLTVRSTATSIVGIVLTLVAALVLVAWWVRTWRKSRRLRRARSTRGAPA